MDCIIGAYGSKLMPLAYGLRLRHEISGLCCSARLHHPSFCAPIPLDASQNWTASASSAMTAEEEMNGYKRLALS